MPHVKPVLLSRIDRPHVPRSVPPAMSFFTWPPSHLTPMRAMAAKP